METNHRTYADPDGAPLSPGQVRLAWRWTASGTTGHGPWTHRTDVVEAWKDSLNRRHAGTIEHWVEIARPEPV